MFFPCYRNCFVFRNPTGSVRNVFLQPFHMNVWYCIIVVGIFVIGTTSFITYLEEKRSGKIRFVNLYTSHKRCSAILYDVFFSRLLLLLFMSLFPQFLFELLFIGRIFHVSHYILMYYYCVSITRNRGFEQKRKLTQQQQQRRSVQWQQPFIDKSFRCCEDERAVNIVGIIVIIVESIKEARKPWKIEHKWCCDCNAKSTTDTQTTSNKWQHVKYSPAETAWSMDGQTGTQPTQLTLESTTKTGTTNSTRKCHYWDLHKSFP